MNSRITLFTLLFLGFSQLAQAQCPNCFIDLPTTLPSDTVYLEAAPDGELGMPYDEDISFRLPLTTTPVSVLDPTVIPGLTIDQITITSISNLPLGLEYEVNQTEFELPDEKDGCVKFCGNPIQSDTFFMNVNLDAVVFGLSQSASFTLAIYIAPSSVDTEGFSMANNIGCGSTTVSFTNNVPSNGNSGYSYSWDFGNGNSSTDENPVDQTYNSPGVYPVNYTATIDTVGFILTTVVVEDTDCNDFNIPPANKPDLYLVLKNPSGNTIYTSNVLTNTDLPATFSLSEEIGAGNYSLEVHDEELIGDEICGTVNFTQTTTGILMDGATEVNLTIVNPIVTVESTDSVIVYEEPAPPIVTPLDVFFCPGDSVTLSADYTENLQWYFNDEAILGATGQELKIGEEGSFYVEYTSPEGCTSVSDMVEALIYTPPVSPAFDFNENLVTITNSDQFPADYTIVWEVDNQVITDNTGLSLCLEEPGTFIIEAIITDNATGCSSEANTVQTYNSDFDCTISSTEEIAALNWKTFPNPVGEVLYLQGELESTAPIHIRLTDMRGVVLYQQERELLQSDFQFEIPVSDLAPGVYLLTMEQEGRIDQKKVVKIR